MSQQWDNFLEKIVQFTSMLLTDAETERIVKSLPKEAKLTHIIIKSRSSENMHKLLRDAKEKKPLCKHVQGCRHNAIRGALRTFIAAYLIKYLVSIVPSLLTGKVFKRPSILRSAGGSDTLRFSLFLSLFVGGYKAMLCFLRSKRGKEDSLNAYISGVIAGLFLILDEKSRRLSIALFLSTRALEFTYVYYMKRGYLPNIPHGDAIVMALSSSQILNAFICDPDTLAKSYFNFLLVHGGISKHGPKGKEFLAEIGEMVKGKTLDMTKYPEIFKNHPASLDLINSRDNAYKLHVSHPHTESCIHGNTTFFIESIPRSLSLYVPLNVVMGIIFRYKLLLKRPDQFLFKTLLQAARSSLFLSMYCTVAWAVPDLFRNLLGKDHMFAYYLNGICSGLCVLIEAKSRRLELAMYCAPRALESFWNCLVKWGYAKNIKHGEVLYFSFAMGFLMMVYENEPDVLNSGFRSVMTRFFGVN